MLQFQQFQDRGVEIQLHSVAVQFGRALRDTKGTGQSIKGEEGREAS